MSTNSQPNETGNVLRGQRDGNRITLPCPKAIIDYMGVHVDRGDQLRGYYNCHSRSWKFYKYIFYFLLDSAITNAFILHTRYTPSPTFKKVKDVAFLWRSLWLETTAVAVELVEVALTSIAFPFAISPPQWRAMVAVSVGDALSAAKRISRMTAAGGAKNVRCGCATQACRTLTAFCSGTKTWERSEHATYKHTLVICYLPFHV